jgi:hypothetical protein
MSELGRAERLSPQVAEPRLSPERVSRFLGWGVASLY